VPLPVAQIVTGGGSSNVRFDFDEGVINAERQRWEGQRKGFFAMQALERECTPSVSQCCSISATP